MLGCLRVMLKWEKKKLNFREEYQLDKMINFHRILINSLKSI